MRGLLAALLLAGTAHADPLGVNDYETMFETHADQLLTDAGGARVLELPEGVAIYETLNGAERLYAGVDMSEGGPVGCLASIYIQIMGYSQACPDLVAPVDEAQLGRLLTFYGANAVPAVEPADLRERFDAEVALNRDQITQCTKTHGVVEVAAFFQGEKGDALLDQVLATPRLPVSNPCF